MDTVASRSVFQTRSVVTVFVRHRKDCNHASRGEFYRGCQCSKFLRYSRGGKQHRQPARTRTWGIAEERAADLQKQLDAGDTPRPIIVKATQATISECIETFITAKVSEGVSPRRVKKLRHQLAQFDAFMSSRSKFFPAAITATDCIEFRSGWGKTWKSTTTRQKLQQNLRGFLRTCCRENLNDLLAALKTIRLSKDDQKRLEPKPFSEEELTRLLAQVPVTFTDSVKAARMTALVHLQVATGLAIRDAMQLEREQISDGWLRLNRQKTGRPVRQKLDAGLHDELIAVTNGNPRYVFWNGTSLPESATGLWQRDLKRLMVDAGLWIKGNLSHRFRDTAVDFWLGEGCSLTEIAGMIGDTVAVCERHYADLASKRMEDRLARLPRRSWSEQGVKA